MGGNALLQRFRAMGAAGALGIGLLVLVGYAVDFGPAWRLAPGLPATHPLSALCIALLGFGLLPSINTGPAVHLATRSAVVLAAAVVGLRLLSPWIGFALFNAITPFDGVVAAQAAANTPIAMGPNTAQALLAIAASEMFRWKRWATASQLLACCAMALLLLALIGYIDKFHTFYGRLAPVTLIGALMLTMSILFATHEDGFVRPLMGKTDHGRLARTMLGWSTPLILFICWITIYWIRKDGLTEWARALLAYQTAAIIILSWILVTTATGRADVIDRRRHLAETSLLHAGATDVLTGLLSRNELEIRRLAGERRRPENTVAELFIDLDRFRIVNEAFGPAMGDEFLMEIGRRLQLIGRPHAVGRLGGDEFAINCTDVTLEEAELIGSAVIAILAMPFTIRGQSFKLTASVGVAHSDAAGDIDLRSAADTAMHVAKARGGNQMASFQISMHEQWRNQVELEQYLHGALENDNELSFAYQPVVAVSDGSLVAVEALARWTHPELGPISPCRFIELAEITGLIVPLGLKLMATAVAQAAIWRDDLGDAAPRINLNISPLQFANGDVIGDLKRLLDQHQLSTAAICIELTESAFSNAHAIVSLEKARNMGFKVAMDDFGVGYSSLSQLPRLPVTTVKLDRSFIVESTESAKGAMMLASIVQLAHGLNLSVVAEGVETQDQLDLVKKVRCEAVQGYIYAKPMTIEDLQVWLKVRAAAE
jgi:diguanylate cyclase (GGDEF)-like protein